ANDFIVCDEVATYRNFWVGWNEVLAPTLIDNRGSAMFISTPHGFNHFFDLYNEELKNKDFKSFHFTSYDNPHIPVEELEREKKSKPSDTFEQEYLANFKKSTGLVYKEFNRSRHVFSKEEGKAFVKTFGGLDFGFTNPCAAITIKKDRFAVYWVTDEWYKTQQTDAQIADYVQALKWDECYPDPESPAAIEELRKRGVNVREVVKNKDSIKNGINVVRELFKTNRLRIHESCRNLIWELETYSYPEPKGDRNEDENPIKDGDHACDSLRYALTMDNALTVEQYHPPIFFQEETTSNPAE
ncbi:MAG: terminase large subunit, partial [Patescibacteria group bacterium]